MGSENGGVSKEVFFLEVMFLTITFGGGLFVRYMEFGEVLYSPKFW